MNDRIRMPEPSNPSDADFIRAHLSQRELGELAVVVDAVRKSHQRGFVLLVGSVARGQRTAESDVDVVAVAQPSCAALHLPTLSVEWYDLDLFVSYLEDGQPSAFAALRDGKVAYDDRTLDEVRSLAERRSLRPTAAAAVREATTEIADARGLLASNAASAAETARSAAKLLASAVLLEAGLLPGSGPELPAQLTDVGEGGLARLVRITRAGTNPAELPEVLDALDTVLARLTVRPPDADRAARNG